MNVYKLILFCCIWFGVTIVLSAQSIQEYNEIFQKGAELLEEEHVNETLAYWDSELNPSAVITDPRIGISYIEAVTANELTERYEEAHRRYSWGLKNPDHSDFKDELEREVERLKPIADRGVFKHWRSLLKEDRFKELGESIMQFWNRLDPTINTSYNERLIEHWRRIDYARNNFNKSSSTVYGTDDRALIYIKFGDPDRKRNGILSYNIGQVQMWVQDAMKMNLAPQGINMGSDSVSRATARAQMRASIARKMNTISNYERNVRFKHRYPSYEIWVYKNILPQERRSLIYIFGNDGDTGEFRLQKSMEDLFPNSAFRSNVRGMQVPPSFFLQLLYYQEVMTVDNYFATAFHELESKIYNIEGVHKWDSQQLRSRNLNHLVHNQLRAPDQQSTLTKGFPEIPLDVYQYRLLSENNEPYFATFLYSRPYRAYYFDQMKTNSFSDRVYNIAGHAMGTNEMNQTLFKKSSDAQKLDPLSSFSGNVDDLGPEVTYMEVPNNPEFPNQKFTIELTHDKLDSNSIGDQLFKENVRAIGTAVTEQVEPLSSDYSILEMGDLILGVSEPESKNGNPFGFRVKPDATIADGENLMVHIEVYHLAGTPSEIVPFQIEYTVTEKKNFFQRIFGSRDKIKLALNFESRSSVFRENLEIDTSPFEPGDYTLELKAREEETGREVARSIQFTIEN